MEQRCAYCKHTENQETIAEVLTKGEYQEQPRQPLGDPTLRPMRDNQDRYTVTEVATDVLTPAVWVRYEPNWAAYQIELISPSWYRKDKTGRHTIQRNQTPDESTLEHLNAQAGKGDVQHCPEATALMLGIDEHRSVPVDMVEINKECGEPGLPAHLDSLSFKDAARLLKTVPNLPRECSCGPTEDRNRLTANSRSSPVS